MNNEQCVTNTHPTVMHNLDSPNIDSSPNIDRKHFSCGGSESCIPQKFSKEFSTDQFQVNFEREKAITVLKYIIHD